MAGGAGIARGNSPGRPVHAKFLAGPLWRLGTFEQEKTGLETPLCRGVSVGPVRRGRRESGGAVCDGGRGCAALRFVITKTVCSVLRCVLQMPRAWRKHDAG